VNLPTLPPLAWVGLGLGAVWLLGRLKIGDSSAATVAGSALGRASVDLADGLVSGAAAVYGGIRSDLRHLHQRVEETRTQADQAHRRITDHDHLEHFHARR